MTGRLTRSRDGVDRVTVRVEYRLTVDEVASLLAVEEESVPGFDPATASVAAINRVVHAAVRADGRGAVNMIEPGEHHRDAARRAYGGAR